MNRDDLLGQVRGLRAAGRTPKQVAWALGVPPAEAARLVREVARVDALSAPEPPVVGCWVSPGWRDGLDAPLDWPDADVPDNVGHGLVCVLVARAHRNGNVTVSGCLVDVYCLGVKDAIPPRVMDLAELSAFRRAYFEPFEVPPVVAPLEMARELVWGAVEYARNLGFEPHPDFEQAGPHLGAWEPTGVVRFGRNGKPYFVQGVNDNTTRILRTLDRSVGDGNYHFLVNA